MPPGRLEKMNLDGSHDYNEHLKKHGHLYFCKKCVRSFQSRVTIQNCKFCGSEVTELNGHNEQLYRYYCPVCYKTTTTKNSIKACPKCSNSFLHVHPADEIGKREFLRMRKREIFGNLKRTFLQRGK